ncbi:MAG: hypothetical protein NT052_01800 [Candidatus Shapirobacteria bacterium]|nr:hypothetical protein [Candidatus Shapirobacteria bacterium]
MEEQNLVQQFPQNYKKSGLKGILIPALIILAIILAGGTTGYLIVKKSSRATNAITETKQLIGGAEQVSSAKEIGIKDEKAFKDTSQGRIEVNDDKNITEGSYKLIRPGGASQTAYLTSSVVDLSQFKGKCVQIWGETFSGQKAGWLMDVGRVKILDSCPEGL